MSTDHIQVTQGTLIFAQGDAGANAFLIERGRIEIFLPQPQGEVRLIVRGPGEIVGEMALLDAGPRSASARALDDCTLCVISAERMARRLDRTDPILRMCLGVVTERYRHTVAMLDGLGRAEVEPAVLNHPGRFAAAVETLSLEGELRRAIARDELELYFQPIVRMPHRELAGFEALLRWNHPERGRLSPGLFIPLAEANGLIVDITAWCIGAVGRLFPRMLAAGLANPGAVEPLFMSLNISGHDLMHGSFADAMATMLAETGLRADTIKLEITESALIDEPKRAAAVLTQCRARGLHFAIDDFGTGYSSLSHLSTMPVTTIKIDQSFVQAMGENPTSSKIVRMMLRLAAELEIPAVAEGVETEAQAAELARLGCALGQGYLFGRPQPFGVTLEVIRRWASRPRRLRTGLRFPVHGRGLPSISAA